VFYVPVALVFTPWQWSETGWLSVQWCRPLHYGVYFFAGMGIGTAGIDVGLVAADGALARRWKLWFAVAIASLIAWMGVTSLTMDGHAPVAIDIAASLCFVVACAAGCFFLIASSLRFGTRPFPILAGLSGNAYSLYLVHYDFVVWLQYALLASTLFALVKAAIVFGVTLALSWLTVLAAQRIPFGQLLFAAPPRAVAKTDPPTQSSPGLYARARPFDSP
jgi:surface polysaccharide O-acyltransferase-like enzyme